MVSGTIEEGGGSAALSRRVTQFEDAEKAAKACVERTLLSAAFDFDFWQPGSPLLAFCARGGIPRPLTARDFDVVLKGRGF